MPRFLHSWASTVQDASLSNAPRQALTRFGSFAGFEIARGNGGLLGLLSLSALDAITVRAYNGNTPVGSSTGASLLGGGVLAGVGGKTLVGFKPTAAFNKIRIEIEWVL